MSRLTSKDSEAAAGRSPLPPPGPFVTPTASHRFSGIQPKFAVLTAKDCEKINGDKKVEDVSETKRNLTKTYLI